VPVNQNFFDGYEIIYLLLWTEVQGRYIAVESHDALKFGISSVGLMEPPDEVVLSRLFC
jgi:hypothetical protein